MASRRLAGRAGGADWISPIQGMRNGDAVGLDEKFPERT